MITTDDRTRLITIYLHDHFAGATAGSRRAARLAEAEATSADGMALAQLADDIAADRASLLQLMKTCNVRPSRLKTGLAAVAESVGALKLNGRVVERSPLSTIVEIEALQMGVRGKRSLWETLGVSMPDAPSADLQVLISRADAQSDLLARLHSDRVNLTLRPRSA